MPAGARRRWLCRLCVPRPGASRSPRTGGRGLLCAEAPTGTFGIRRSARSCHSLCFPRPETPALGAAVGNPAAGKAAGEAVPARRLWGPLPAPAPGIHGALLACRPRAPAPASPDGSPVAEGLPRPHTLLQNVPHSAWCPGHPLYGCREGGQASSQEAGEGAERRKKGKKGKLCCFRSKRREHRESAASRAGAGRLRGQGPHDGAVAASVHRRGRPEGWMLGTGRRWARDLTWGCRSLPAGRRGLLVTVAS